MEKSDVEKFIADAIAFSVIGISATTQHLVHIAAGEATDDLELIAEESLALTSVTTARAFSFVLSEYSALRSTLIPTILEVPLRYYDYILGNQILEQRDQGDEDAGGPTDATYSRIVRKIEFYAAHFPEGVYPGNKLAAEKMVLWMGRISSPGLHEHPEKRTERLGLSAILSRHLRLVKGFTTQLLADSE